MLRWLHRVQGQPETCSKPFSLNNSNIKRVQEKLTKNHLCIRILGVGLSNLYFVSHIPLIVINPKVWSYLHRNALLTFLCYENARPSSVHFHQIDTFLCYSSRTPFLSAARSWLWHNGLWGCYQRVICYESLAFSFYSYVSLANFYVPAICLPFLIDIWWRQNYHHLTLPLLWGDLQRNEC